MNATNAKNIILGALKDFGLSLVYILGTCLVIGLGILIYRNGWALIKGVTMPDVRYIPYGNVIDRMTYKPWKGYKRYRSRKWNMEHMPE